MRTSALVIAALFASAQAIRLEHKFADGMSDSDIIRNQLSQAEQRTEGICDGPNGSNMQDCRTTRHGDQNPVCRGRDGEESERNCVNRTAYGISAAQIPSDPWKPNDHVPICTGRPGEAKEYNCLDRSSYDMAYSMKLGPKPSLAQSEGICDGPNGSNMQDCRTTRHGDQNPVCRGRDGEESERNCVNRTAYGIATSLAQEPKPYTGEPVVICDGTNSHNCVEPDQIGRASNNLAQEPKPYTGEPVVICDGTNSHNCVEANKIGRPNLAQNLPICNGTNGAPGVDCRAPSGLAASLVQEPNPTGAPIAICNGTNSHNCIEPEQLTRPVAAPVESSLVTLTMTNGSTYVVTCSDRQQEDCQPVCTESLSRGCTEARTPNWPSQDRFEGKYTHK
jgi:hypothetical protein